MHRVRSILLFLLVALAVAYPPLASFQRQGIAAPFKYFAPDTFYYLAIADHSADIPNYTYDGIYPTNGFHPLWEYLLTAAFGHFDALNNQPNQILFVFFSSIILAAIGAGLIGVALLRLTGNFAITLLSILPGAYWIFFSHLNPHYGAIWSFINGMESPLSIFLFGVLLVMLINMRMLASPSPAAIATVSAVMTLMTLSRLDDIFILLPFCGYIAWMAKDRRERLRNLAAGCVIPAIAIGGYMLYNLDYAGTAIPLSGLSKGGLAVVPGVHDLIGTFLPVKPFANTDLWEALSWRALQVAIPAAAAALWLVKLTKERERNDEAMPGGAHYPRLMLGVLSLYVIAKGLYNLINVAPCYQGHWYYPLSIITCNMIVAMFIRGMADGMERTALFELPLPLRRGRNRRAYPVIIILAGGSILCVMGALALAGMHLLEPVEVRNYDAARLTLSGSLLVLGLAFVSIAPPIIDRIRKIIRHVPCITTDLLGPVTAVISLGIAILSANAFTHTREESDYNAPYYRVWRDREEIASGLRRHGAGGGIIEFDDGILSYSLGIPAMSGYGLALDRDGYRARAAGHLLDTAYRRGFRAFSTVTYMSFDSACDSPDTLLRRLKGFSALEQERLDRWRFSVLWRDAITGIALIGFSPGPRGS